MKRKLYIHYEPAKGSNGKGFTLPFSVDSDQTVETLLKEILSKAEQLIGIASISSCKLSIDTGKVISYDLKANIMDIIADFADLEDLFLHISATTENPIPAPSVTTNTAAVSPSVVIPSVASAVVKTTETIVTSKDSNGTTNTPKLVGVVKPPLTNATTTKATTTTTATSTTSPTSPKVSSSTSSDATKAKASSSPKTFLVTPAVLEARRRLEDCMQKKQYKNAKTHINILLETKFDINFATNCLIHINLHTARYEEAVIYGQRALQQDKQCLESYYLLGRALYMKRDYEVAIDILEKGMKLWMNKSIRCLQPNAIKDDHFYLDLLSLQAQCLFASGDHNDAANLLNQIMNHPYCDRNLNILITYATFAFQYQKMEESVIALLKSIAIIGTSRQQQTSLVMGGGSVDVSGNNGSLGSSCGSGAGSSGSSLGNSGSGSTGSSTYSSSGYNNNNRLISNTIPSPPSNKGNGNNSINNNKGSKDDASSLDLGGGVGGNGRSHPTTGSSILDKRVKSMVAEILMHPLGYQEFMKQFPALSKESGEIYAYLGTTVKEYSGIQTAIALYSQAMKVQPENPSYVLNLVHLYELKAGYAGNPSPTIGTGTAVASATTGSSSSSSSSSAVVGNEMGLKEAIDCLRLYYFKNSSQGFAIHAYAYNSSTSPASQVTAAAVSSSSTIATGSSAAISTVATASPPVDSSGSQSTSSNSNIGKKGKALTTSTAATSPTSSGVVTTTASNSAGGSGANSSNNQQLITCGKMLEAMQPPSSSIAHGYTLLWLPMMPTSSSSLASSTAATMDGFCYVHNTGYEEGGYSGGHGGTAGASSSVGDDDDEVATIDSDEAATGEAANKQDVKKEQPANSNSNSKSNNKKKNNKGKVATASDDKNDPDNNKETTTAVATTAPPSSPSPSPSTAAVVTTTTTTSTTKSNLVPTSQVASASLSAYLSTIPRYPFSSRELDLLALFATTVKIYYLQGHLSRLPALIHLVERVRIHSLTPLHETMIRNEMAYYLDILHILVARTSGSLGEGHGGGGAGRGAIYGLPDRSYALNDPLVSNKPFFQAARRTNSTGGSGPIYMLGDSHCLSAAWSVLTIRNIPRLIIPKLVTGVKQWHLRPESHFYPKAQFMNSLASIPMGSEVIISLGEIDCREGFLTAVERDYYATIEEAMKKTIVQFMKVVKDIRAARKFKIYIHPVAPALNETRSIVILFNTLYAKAVHALKDDQVQWIDFFSELLRPATSPEDLFTSKNPLGCDLLLKEKYQLDGTHLHPCYLELLEASLNKLVLTTPSVTPTTSTSATPNGNGKAVVTSTGATPSKPPTLTTSSQPAASNNKAVTSTSPHGKGGGSSGGTANDGGSANKKSGNSNSGINSPPPAASAGAATRSPTSSQAVQASTPTPPPPAPAVTSSSSSSKGKATRK